MSCEWAFVIGVIAGCVGGFLAGMFAALDNMKRRLEEDRLLRRMDALRERVQKLCE